MPVTFESIVLFYLENEITHLYTQTERTYIVPESLEELERKLEPIFYRVNRQLLVNRKAVADAVEHFPRKLLLNLATPFQ